MESFPQVILVKRCLMMRPDQGYTYKCQFGCGIISFMGKNQFVLNSCQIYAELTKMGKISENKGVQK